MLVFKSIRPVNFIYYTRLNILYKIDMKRLPFSKEAHKNIWSCTPCNIIVCSVLLWGREIIAETNEF